MSDYHPDAWVILKIVEPKADTVIYKVLAGWRGSYLDGEAWKINSGITKIEQDDQGFHYHGYSGSVYHCNHHAYGTTSLLQSIYDDYAKRIVEAGYPPLEMLSEAEAFALKVDQHE